MLNKNVILKVCKAFKERELIYGQAVFEIKVNYSALWYMHKHSSL